MHLTFNDWRDLESRLRQTASISFLFSHFTSFFGKVWYQNRQPNKSYNDFNASRILAFDHSLMSPHGYLFKTLSYKCVGKKKLDYLN